MQESSIRETIPKKAQEISLYIHIPFCTSKCPYCHFYVVIEKEEFKDLLLQALHQELLSYKDAIVGKELVSVYFGGGTPSLFGPKRCEKVLSLIHSLTPITKECEITLEANPEHISHELMHNFKTAGITRLSVGIQSFLDEELSILGRKASAKKAEEALFISEKAGFSNISIDLMYETPKQSLKSFQQSLEKVAFLPITHLSLYNLTIEPYTAYARKEAELKKEMADPETAASMYSIAIETLEKAGLRHYEISAFAKYGRISKHNTGYWTGREFLGLGPSAFSFYQNKRFRNIANLVRYAKLLEEGKSPVDFVDECSKEARKKELLALNLRLIQGVHLPTFCNHFGQLTQETYASLKKLCQEGLLQEKENGDRVMFTKRGLFFYDTIATEII